MTNASDDEFAPTHCKRPRPVLPSMWAFPPPDDADDDGVVGTGADLAPGTLVDAYRNGTFPWPHPQMPTPWFSPNPRAIIPVDDIHIARSLARMMRASTWYTTVNRSFTSVMQACAERADETTWITDEMLAAYTRLHELSWAHSIEVWDDDALIGGVYGVQVGAVFTAESMFFRRTNASKVALVALCRRFAAAGGVLIDAQIQTEHLRTLGAKEIPRHEFLHALRLLRDREVAMELAPHAVKDLQ